MSGLAVASLESYSPPPGLAEAVEADLRRRGGRLLGSELRFTCPAHDDSNPSADYNRVKHTWLCRSCGASGGIEDLAKRLGIDPAHYRLERVFPHLVTKASSSETVTETWQASSDPPAALSHAEGGLPAVSYEVRDASGRLFAIHARFENPDGGKEFRWWRNGAWSLGGLRSADAPLYGAELLAKRPDEPLIVTEGEKAATALRGVGLLALGTVTGANGTPCPRALAALAGRQVVLWPDNDQVGREHMQRIVADLQKVTSKVKIFEPPGLAEGADAEEYLADRGEVEPNGLLAMIRAQARDPKPIEAGPVRQPSPLVLTRARCLADVVPQAVSFLWRPRLPLGKLTLLDGDPGQGKSFIAAAIATALSLGKGLPEANDFEPVSSLLFTAEDGLEDTLRPRTEAMGADLSRVFAYEHAIDLSKPDGLAMVAQEIRYLRPALVVIDPIVAYLGGRTDMHRANEIRAILAPLASLAASYSCSILAVRHLSKARNGRALHAGLGSVDFTAAARSVLLAGSSAADPETRALVHIKSNLAGLAPSLGYRLTEDGQFAWTGRSSLTASDLLEPEISGKQWAARDEATDWLNELLNSGPVPASEVKSEADKAGIAWRTVERAAARLDVKKSRVGFGREGVWQWSLAREAA